MKTQILKKQIIRNFSIAGIFAAVLAVIFYLYSDEKDGVKSKIDKINSETSEYNAELADLQSKTAEIKKYKELWPKISPNRKSTHGIKINEVKKMLKDTAEKYGISEHNIKLSLPEIVKTGAFKRKTVNVMMSDATINFMAVNDVKAMKFVEEFIGSLNGYPVITSFTLNKSKDYESADLVNISTGKNPGVVSGKIDFFWYVYTDLEEDSDVSKEGDAKGN